MQVGPRPHASELAPLVHVLAKGVSSHCLLKKKNMAAFEKGLFIHELY